MSFSTRCMTAADWAEIAPEFAPTEFNYPDKMGYEFMLWLKDLRKQLGLSLDPSSDHRPPERNADAGGASKSAHMDVPCNAIDFSSKDMTSTKRLKLVLLASKLGCRRIGIYANGSVHLDRGDDGRSVDVMWVKV